MNQKTYIIGHKNPDTDSICSAIGYARFKQLQGDSQTVAIRAGEINPQTEFVLNTWQTAAPPFLPSLIPNVGQAMTPDVVYRHPETSIKEILQLIEENNIRLIPIADEQKRYRGIVSLFDIAQEFYWSANPQKGRVIFTSVNHIHQALGGKILFAENRNETFSAILLIGAMQESSFIRILSNLEPQKCVVITGDREEIQKAAIGYKVKALVVTGNLPVSASICEMAQQRQVNLVNSPYDSAVTMNLIKLSAPAYRVAQKRDGHLTAETPLEQAKPKILEARNRGMVVLDSEEKLIGIITRADLLRYAKPRLILVDHNELSQAVEGSSQAEIMEIIDHHRLANPQTLQPILFLNQPVGSTCTIIAKLYFDHQVDLDKQTAGLLLSGIISDTLNLKSPTATSLDARIMEKLNTIAGINIEEYSNQMFGAGTNLADCHPEEVVLNDFKEYKTDKITFGVGQIEVVGFGGLEKIKPQLIEGLKKARQSRTYHFSALLVTDISASNSLLIFDGTQNLLHRIDYPLLEPHIAELKGVLSRKKQLLPHLLTIFKDAEP